MGKNVYLLGAGASAASDFNLPTMQNLIFEGLFKKHEHLSKFVERYYPSSKCEEIDVEELITFIDLCDGNFSFFGDYPDPDLWHVKNELYIYLRDRLMSDPARQCCEKLKKLFEDHKSEECPDSIITLNYDLIVDKTLASLSKRSQHGDLSAGSIMARSYHLINETVYMGGMPFSPRQDRAYYLKLHGSLDWYYCSNSQCRFHQIFFANRMEPWPQTSDNSLCQLCGSRAVAVIVPPNINKSLQKFPKLSYLWNLACREIKIADTLVIIGLSFRDADYYLKWLLKNACRTAINSNRRIEIVDKNEMVVEKVEKLTGVKPTHFKSLDEYLNSRTPSS